MSNKSLKSSQILRAHMTYFRRPSHKLYLNLQLFNVMFLCQLKLSPTPSLRYFL